jgi:S1-C subfamily serine protease
MGRAIVLAACALLLQGSAVSQTLSVLHIKVVVVDADRKATPVPRHALLISDNPASAPPRRVVTGADGTVDVRLRPGNYTVESDRPVSFGGKAYQWAQIIDIAAGHDAVLELTADNAEVASAGGRDATATNAAPLEPDPSFLLPKWQGSVVAIWTPYTRASGFVVDAKGLVATSQHAIGRATSAEVQFSPTTKVAATVVASDAARDVAILRINAQATAAIPPIPLSCGDADKPVADRQDIFTIGVPMFQQATLSSGVAVRRETPAIDSDLVLATGAAGGPVFASDGRVVGVTSALPGEEETRRGEVRIVPAAAVCEVTAGAQKKMTEPAPAATHLPTEPAPSMTADALKSAAAGHSTSANGYQLSASTFDVTFITPPLSYAAQLQATGRDRFDTDQAVVRPLLDFSNWSEYVSAYPPVLLIRATPKMVEGFWTTVARGAARTQGVAVPPIKHYKSGFGRMRVYCGDTEVPPIHPFKLEQRVSDTDAIDEGLYVFDPGALGPQCGSVKLVLYSDKEPDKPDTRVVDPNMVKRVWQDFAASR